MPSKKCRSNCTTNKTIASCNTADKCSYTNGPKRKFCRLSTKYRMNPPECNITRKFLKREKASASKIQRFLTRKYRSKSIHKEDVEIEEPKAKLTNEADANKLFEEEIKKVKNKAQTRRIQGFLAKKMKELKRQKEINVEKILPVPPALVDEPPNEAELKKITDKAHTRRIQRFMKAVNPAKRRSAYLNGVCSDSGVCIAFGKHTATIKKHFDRFIHFSKVKSLRKIGAVSANGFVKELEYEEAGYKSHAVLKSSEKANTDNLYYEYLVGLFLNEQSKYSPIFVETYGTFVYNSDAEYENMKKLTATKDELNGLHVERYPGDSCSYDKKKSLLGTSCELSKHFAVLIQHIKDAETISEKCVSSVSFVEADLPFVLYQIYHTLYLLNKTFTHNDLHTENVLIYEPVKGGYIQYYYHSKDGSVLAFKSAYIPKIIDYGRCFYDFNRPETREDVYNNSRTIYEEVCEQKKCSPLCGALNGYIMLQPSSTRPSSYGPNISMDLRLLKMIRDGYKDFGGDNYIKMKKNVITHNADLNELLNKVNFKTVHFTPEDKKLGSSNWFTKKINNVIDAFIRLSELVKRFNVKAANELKYAKYKKIGDMHVYEDRPLEFISA
jgi:hypothetical protein